jgi:CCR4-NOT complex subunit CAF16
MGGGGQDPSTAGSSAPMAVVETSGLEYRYGGGATIHTREYSDLKLTDVTLSIEKGARVLIAGANGAGKSTFMSILGGQKMVPQDSCRMFDKPVFHDTTLAYQRMYCGDWWRTNFFHNLSAAEVIGEERLKTPRVQRLVDILQLNVSWRVNSISDGQRRRVQLLDALAEEKEVYVLDEITTDLDLYAREELLNFLRQESDERGATVLYATHIFDQLSTWATHFLFFSGGKVRKFCRFEEFQEYHALVEAQTRVPLYMLIKQWVHEEYPETAPMEVDEPAYPAVDGHVIEMKNMSYRYAEGLPVALKDCSFSFGRGARVLLIGANGSCKSTAMSILGGKLLVPRGGAEVLGKDCFNDGTLQDVMYCGDWWRSNFFMNLTVREVMGKNADTARTKHLAGVLQVPLEWRINNLSDGQRRRCQLLEILATPRPVYLMDEITSDLDLYARDGVLKFLKTETETRGATIVYCTHIFDHLDGWPTHLLRLSKGQVVTNAPIDQIPEYAELINGGNLTPLCSLVRNWIYAEYGQDQESKPWRALDTSLDGRRPNLGLAGPIAG